MSKRNVYVPSELVDEIFEIIKKENYSALQHIFIEYKKGDSEYLCIDEHDASNLLRLADIEMSKAILRYPHNEEDDPLYNPEHDERYDDVMMGLYEKLYYYITSEFKQKNDRHGP